MDEEKKNPRRGDENEKKKWDLGGLFYHNTFVLIFSFCVALVSWFFMEAGNTENNTVIRDVPILVNLSSAAEEDGIRVFNQTYVSADLEIAGNSLITNKLTAEDFKVTATLNPTSTKLTGNTLQKTTLQVRAEKNTSVSDYNIVSISPEEITVEYDRYKEAAFVIESDGIIYSADTGYHPGKPVLSAEKVTVSGPESSVNKISRAAVSYTLSDPLKADASFTSPVRLYDQNNQEITDTVEMYVEMDVDTVDVSIPILSKKTVNIVASTVHQPKGFADNRITVEPAQIDIVGSAEALSAINEITLDTPIDFADLDISQKNVFTMDIPLPTGVRNISAGENSVSQATVSINLNGYQRVSVTVPKDNFQISNSPAGKDVTINTQLLAVVVIGSEAQVSKLTGDSLSVQVDLANFGDSTGSVVVPVTVSVTGSGSDSCWVWGKNTVSAVITDKSTVQTDGRMLTSSEALVATPQE